MVEISKNGLNQIGNVVKSTIAKGSSKVAKPIMEQPNMVLDNTIPSVEFGNACKAYITPQIKKLSLNEHATSAIKLETGWETKSENLVSQSLKFRLDALKDTGDITLVDGEIGLADSKEVKEYLEKQNKKVQEKIEEKYKDLQPKYVLPITHSQIDEIKPWEGTTDMRTLKPET